ncbi:MAG: uracil-DNA glycosylase [Gemmatimonas sp.]
MLDSLAVDDVMALLGARSTAKSPRHVRAPVSAMTPPTPVPPSEPAPDAPRSVPEPRFDERASGDWRQALGAANSADSVAKPKTSGDPTQPDVPTRAAVLPAWLTSLGFGAGVSAGDGAPGGQSTVAFSALTAATSLNDVSELVRACTRCALHASARNPVPGEGDPRAELMCVGEAPGATEDEQGKPFVGEAGQLLTKILAGIELSRDAVYICNVLKHRPPSNRDPLPDEVLACQPFLQRQVQLIRPRVILALGRFAAQSLLGTSSTLGKLRGQVHEYLGIPVVVTYHPAAVLRNIAWKRPTWEDVKMARAILNASRAANIRADDR